MYHCPYCGTSIPDQEYSCPGCGRILQRNASEGGGRRRLTGLLVAVITAVLLAVIVIALWFFRADLGLPGFSKPDPAPVITPSFHVTPTPLPAVDPTAMPTEEPLPLPDKLETGTWWQGYMYFDDYESDDGRSREKTAIFAYFGTTAEGRDFFEIYDGEDPSEAQVLYSVYIDLYEDHFVPVIGEDDAWILDMYLFPEEAADLAVNLEDGFLWFSYPYNFDGERCTVSVVLMPKI